MSTFIACLLNLATAEVLDLRKASDQLEVKFRHAVGGCVECAHFPRCPQSFRISPVCRRVKCPINMLNVHRESLISCHGLCLLPSRFTISGKAFETARSK